ncbi:unnamed protein product [Lota lota]
MSLTGHQISFITSGRERSDVTSCTTGLCIAKRRAALFEERTYAAERHDNGGPDAAVSPTLGVRGNLMRLAGASRSTASCSLTAPRRLGALCRCLGEQRQESCDHFHIPAAGKSGPRCLAVHTVSSSARPGLKYNRWPVDFINVFLSAHSERANSTDAHITALRWQSSQGPWLGKTSIRASQQRHTGLTPAAATSCSSGRAALPVSH